MKVFLISETPIGSLKEQYSNDPPADFLIEDLIEVSQHISTSFVNDLSIALDKLKDKNSKKFIYEIDIKELV